MILYSSELKSNPEVQRDQRIQNADRVVRPDGPQLLQFSVVKVVDGETLDFTHRIVDYDEAFVPTRCVGRACRVCQVMSYRKTFSSGNPGKSRCTCARKASRENTAS